MSISRNDNGKVTVRLLGKFKMLNFLFHSSTKYHEIAALCLSSLKVHIEKERKKEGREIFFFLSFFFRCCGIFKTCSLFKIQVSRSHLFMSDDDYQCA